MQYLHLLLCVGDFDCGFEKFHQILLQTQFQQSNYDLAMFLSRSFMGITILLVCVDHWHGL